AGGVSLHAVRRLNARAVRRAKAALEAGDARVLLRLHTAAILRDAGRAAVVTALGLGLALLARTYLAGTISVRGVLLLDVAAVGSALAVGTAGTLRLVGRGPDLRWFAAGVASGAARAGGAAAHRAVRPAGLARGPAGVGGMAAVHVGAGAHRRGARVGAAGRPGLPRALQRRSCGVALVGAAGGLDARGARGRGAAPAAAAAGHGGVGAGHGVRGGRRPAA